MTAPKRRWFRFSLRTLFVVVTVGCLLLGWQVQVVQKRRVLAERIRADGGVAGLVVQRGMTLCILNGSSPQPSDRFAASVGWFRSLIGDMPVTFVKLPEGSTEIDLQRARATFPEAQFSVDR